MAVHLGEEFGDFAESRAQGAGQRLAAGNGDGRIGDDRLVLGGFLGQRGGVRLVEAVFGEGGRFFRDGGTEVFVKELRLGDEFGVAESLPGGEGKVDLGGVRLASLIFQPTGEGLADFVGDGLKLLFLPGFVGGVAGGGGLLFGGVTGQGGDFWAEFGGAGGECGGFLVLPDGLEFTLVE